MQSVDKFRGDVIIDILQGEVTAPVLAANCPRVCLIAKRLGPFNLLFAIRNLRIIHAHTLTSIKAHRHAERSTHRMESVEHLDGRCVDVPSERGLWQYLDIGGAFCGLVIYQCI